MNTIKTLFFGTIITFSAFGQTAQRNSQPTIEATWKSIDENGYSIQYPDSWDVDKSGTMGMSFMILSKLTSPQDQFRENVNLLIQDLTGQNINLEKFVEISQSQIKTMVVSGNILENKTLNSGGKEYQRVVYSGDLNQFKFKFQQYYWVIQDKAYILTLTCEAAQFDAYHETGEKIMNSFRLK
jgi:hypothetical protein